MEDNHIHDLPGLLQTLAQPRSQQEYVESEAKLSANYREPGFFPLLQQVAAEEQLPRDVRFLASLVVAREVPKKWRAKTIIPDDIKPQMRSTFFRFFSEPDLPLARSQLGLLVSVARIDYPRTWPTLLDEMYAPLQHAFGYVTAAPVTASEDPGSEQARERSKQKTILLNCLWTWNAFVKEWRGVKLPAGTQLMAKFMTDLYGPMSNYLAVLMARTPNIEDWQLMEAARYAFKLTAKLVEWEFSKTSRTKGLADSTTMQSFMTSSLEHLSNLQSMRLQLLASPYFSPPSSKPDPIAVKTLQSVTKFVRAIGKTYVALLHIDPKGFVDVPGTVQAVGWWWGEVGAAVKEGLVPDDDDMTVRYPKRFLLVGMTLFKNILSVLSTEQSHIFNDTFITEAFNLIVDHLLPLNVADWELWSDDPEEWFVQDADAAGAGWTYEFRPLAERTLLGLASAARNHDIMVPLMAQKLQASISSRPQEPEERIKQDAVLCAAGRMSRLLSKQIKLQDVLQAVTPIIGSTDPEDRLLKRRIVWLIGQWVTGDEECAKLPVIWQILLHALQAQGEATDISVKLAAVVSIHQCVDLWEMDIAYFRPYLGQLVTEMLTLMGQATSLPGKKHILDALTVVIDRIKTEVLPFLNVITEAIPSLWSASGGLDGEWLYKAALVTLTTKLVTAIGAGAGELLALVVPLVEESLQGAAKEHFEEDGLELWQETLRNITDLEPAGNVGGLTRLLLFLINLLGQNLDLQAQALALMDSYIMLDGANIMALCGQQIVQAYLSALNMANKESIPRVLESLQLLVRVVPKDIWSQAFAAVGIVQKFCKEIDNDKSSGTVLAAYLCTFCHIIIVDPTLFVALVEHVGPQNNTTPYKQLEETLDAMWRAFDYVGKPSSRKLIALAMANLLTTGHPQVFERLDGEIVNVFMDVLGEVKESQINDQNGTQYVLHWKDDHVLSWLDVEGKSEGKRREALEVSDPVYAQALVPFLGGKLQQAQAVGMHPYWEKLDADVKRQLEVLLA